MSNAVNHGDVRRYDATVVDTYDEGLIDVFCPSLAEGVLRAVPPGSVPVGIFSTPDPGQPVVIEERFGATMEESISWTGWTPAMQEAASYQREGVTAMVSPDTSIAVVLDQGVVGDTDADTEPPVCAVGRHDATEAAVLGDSYQSWTEDLIEIHKRFIDEVEKARAVAKDDTLGAILTGIISALSTYLSSVSGAWTSVGEAGAAAAATTAQGAISGLSPTVVSATAKLAGVEVNLASVKSDMDTHTGDIGDHLSSLVKVAGE